MEEAARARRNFQDKYHIEKQKETDLQGKAGFPPIPTSGIPSRRVFSSMLISEVNLALTSPSSRLGRMTSRSSKT
jgi:hypothetical protein